MGNVPGAVKQPRVNENGSLRAAKKSEIGMIRTWRPSRYAGSAQMLIWRVRGAAGLTKLVAWRALGAALWTKEMVRRGLGAIVAPRGAQGRLHVRKPHSRPPLGPPFGRPFSVFFFDFSVFVLHLFFEGRFGGLPGAI